MITLLFWAAVGYWLYRWHCRAKRIDNGERWLIVDASDTLARTLVAVMALIVCSLIMYALVEYALTHQQTLTNDTKVFLAIIVPLYLFAVWHEGRKIVENLAAGPGELRTETWPLPVGQMAEVTYSRHVRAGLPKGQVDAELVHYVIEVYRGGSGKRRERRIRSQVIPLTEGEASFRGGRLEATWRFQVPFPMGEPTQALFSSVIALFTSRNRSHEWFLEVKMPLETGLKLDSKFKLKLDYSAGAQPRQAA